MEKYKLKFTRLQNEILSLLSIKAGAKLSKREISIYLEVSPTAIAKALKDLKEVNLIVELNEKRINFSEISLNRDNNDSILFKKLENLRLILNSSLIDFLEEKFPGTTIILFGSYYRGEDLINSDIDIAIIGSKEKSVDLEAFQG